MEQVDPVALARSLRQARKAAGLTQVELAKKAHKAPSTLSVLESGKVRPHLGTILDFADALGVAPEDLIGDAANPKVEAPQPEENGLRRGYPYPWMSEALGDLLAYWKKAVEQGYSPGYCHAISSGAYDALDAIVPPLEAERMALPQEELRERQLLGRELLQLAHDAYAVFEESGGEPDAREEEEAHRIKARREEMVRRTKEIA